MFSLSGPVCQSCGIPLSMDERRGGTEADVSRNTEYCSHCYVNGNFTYPIMIMAQMAQRVAARIRDLHVSESSVSKVTQSLPGLTRWKPKAPPIGRRWRRSSPE